MVKKKKKIRRPRAGKKGQAKEQLQGRAQEEGEGGREINGRRRRKELSIAIRGP